MGQFLLVEIRRVRRFEFGEVEFLPRAGLGVVVLGGRRREVQVAGFVEGEPAAFPELFGCC